MQKENKLEKTCTVCGKSSLYSSGCVRDQFHSFERGFKAQQKEFHR